MSTRRTADPREVACIESQVDVLRRLQFPGVVPLEGFDRQGDTVTIQLGDDLPPLGEQPPGSAAECAALGAALSRTIGEVHRAGYVHCDLRSDTVLVDTGGRPLLSGFDRATVATPEARREDLRSLVALLTGVLALLSTTDRADERRCRRRLARALRPRRHSDTFELAFALAELAADFDEKAPASTPASVDSPAGPPTDDLRSRINSGATLPHRWALPALLLLLSVVGIIYVVGADRESRPVLAPDGPIVEFDGQRYQVGRPGDVAVVGDWAGDDGGCNGSSTVVLLRPETGELFAFSGWAETGELVASRLGTHRDAVDLAVVTGGCDELLVVDDGDLRTPVVVG